MADTVTFRTSADGTLMLVFDTDAELEVSDGQVLIKTEGSFDEFPVKTPIGDVKRCG